VVLMLNRGEYLGDVEAASLDAAELAAVKTFSLTEFQRKRLHLQEQLYRKLWRCRCIVLLRDASGQ
jgi:hypothetical protein